MFAQRFDSILSLIDIRRVYDKDNRRKLVDTLKELKEFCGSNLRIKQFPTGAASVQDFKVYLRELNMRDFYPEILYVDYINLMKSAYKKSNDLYTSVKSVAEELRALSFEFKIPVVSVSQLNRESGFVGFEEMSYNYIAESLGVPATADFMSIFGIDEDKLIYESELHNKIVKNRLGGRVGDVCLFYYDNRSLKMYDESESELWITDSKTTGDSRNIKQAERESEQTQPKRRKKK